MAKNIEPKLKKIGDYLNSKKILFLPYRNTSVRILGALIIAISCGKTSMTLLKAKARIDTSSEQLLSTVRIMTQSMDLLTVSRELPHFCCY